MVEMERSAISSLIGGATCKSQLRGSGDQVVSVSMEGENRSFYSEGSRFDEGSDTCLAISDVVRKSRRCDVGERKVSPQSRAS